ncbi:hypothetical protein [Pelobacter propionicus]|nr:hypothetical protein [Pelobacter propionicus]
MRRLLLVLTAVGLFGAMPAFAGHADMKMEHEGARQCALQSESIQEKVKRLEAEIAKGEKKYSAEDLKKLENKLKETNDFIDKMKTSQ